MLQPWFAEAKLGIFIHWGIYAVNGIPESWSFFKGEISYDDYLRQLECFTAKEYDPADWAALFKRAGARYAVLTTKHHDGVALWDTAQNDLSIPKRAPAGRDLIGPYCEAMRDAGLHVGLYFSHLDWSHPDYAPVPPQERNQETLPARYADWPEGADTPAWQRFLTFHRGQLLELCQRYSPELFWFDGDWTPDASYWRMAELRDLLQQWRPGVILNSRMRGYGDYGTPEQGIPIVPPADEAWEFSVTMNDSWGYQGSDTNYKSVRQLVRMFAECIGMGGNMLLDIGPREDGRVPSEQVERLEELGDWIRKYEEAVYPTKAGLPAGHIFGSSTLSQDRETLYAFIFDRPWEQIAVKGIQNTIRQVTNLGTGNKLEFRKIGGAPWVSVPGVLWIDLPEGELDPLTTVVKIEFEGPLELYRGSGQAIEAN